MTVKPTSIDHLVLPVQDLTQMRQRYDALGFHVSADARHPFGTKNACVFLADGTYLEPLAVDDRMLVEREAVGGNAFLRRDQAYRFRVGEEGLSAVAMQSSDMRADFEDYAADGFAYGKPLEFRRIAKQGDDEIELIARLGFAVDERAPDASFFACERHGMEALWSPDHTRQPNGVTGLSAVLISEQNPTDFQYVLQSVTGLRDFASSSNGLSFHMAGADIICFTPQALEQVFAVSCDRAERGLRFEAVVFTCADIDHLASQLEAQGVHHIRHLGRVVVPPGAGQGVSFIFEKAES